ncbi:hypothetical protein [Agrobacterium sp. rho-13.3]|uniref:hypothetical protein n=1 Tax=Agrobacterium sp. rho-13.3 TaxID=3072980 RepID=UPI003D7BC604
MTVFSFRLVLLEILALHSRRQNPSGCDEKECADLHIGNADALEHHPAVPKERFQGRNYTSLMRRVAHGPAKGVKRAVVGLPLNLGCSLGARFEPGVF